MISGSTDGTRNKIKPREEINWVGLLRLIMIIIWTLIVVLGPFSEGSGRGDIIVKQNRVLYSFNALFS